jgi:hypothetical protein
VSRNKSHSVVVSIDGLIFFQKYNNVWGSFVAFSGCSDARSEGIELEVKDER